MDKPLIYISHPIRGKAGDNATPEEIARNNRYAINEGNWLSENFPDYNFYIPGKMDGFLLRHGIEPRKIVEGLLALDFAIIDISIGIIVLDTREVSTGMIREIARAKSIGVRVFNMNSISLFATDDEYGQKIAEWLEAL